jgi:Periplasmic binding protein-like domain
LGILGTFVLLRVLETGGAHNPPQRRRRRGDGAARVALVGFDEFALADKLTPPVTVVAQDPAAIGATAAQLLFARIDGDTSSPRDVLLLTRLVPRGSGEIGPDQGARRSAGSARPRRCR